ncbi:hypothetical protein ACLOJK_023918 [Asimina triloba]
MKFPLQGQTATPNPTQLLITLNALIAKLSRSHQHSQAFHLFSQIHSSVIIRPDHYTLTTTLTSCTTLRHASAANQLHALTIRLGYRRYAHVGNALLSFYAKSDDFSSARQLFDEFASPDLYSWTILLSACARLGQIDQASLLFERAPQRNVAVWNSIITGCVECSRGDVALGMFCRMHQLGVKHDHYSFASVLNLCCLPEVLDSGRQVHSLIMRTGFLAKVSVVNSLITMYFNCGVTGDAYGIFEETLIGNQITFNAMIAGLVSCRRDVEALDMFLLMEYSFKPTELTLVSVMSACASAEMVRVGNQIHAQMIKMGFEAFVVVSNASINMYMSCGDLSNAWLVFERMEEKDLISWNSMITGFAQGNCWESAISFYKQMLRVGIEPDDFTFGSLLAYTKLSQSAEMIQAVLAKKGLIFSTQVGNALISAFATSSKIQQAYQVFGEMNSRNLISWNSIISGCVLNGLTVLSFELFYQMQIINFKPNGYTLSIILSACASISALMHGKQVHAYILRSGLDSEVSLGNPLITMYAKSGVLDWSSRVFQRMHKKDVVSWNAMIAAYAQHGKGEKAIHYFKEMRESGVQPDVVTFTTILSACSHAGLVDEGRWIFSYLVEDYKMKPSVDHYSCMVDLLGRAGHIDEAERLIGSMQVPADSSIWWALLSACSSHGHVRLGKVAAGFLLESEPENPAVYVLLSNIYAASGQWEEAAGVRELMKMNGVIKKPGYSWMELQK